MNTKIRAFALLFASFALAVSGFGQATMQSTTFAVPVLDSSAQPQPAARYVVYLNSCTNVLAPSVAAAQGDIGVSSSNNYYLLYSDREIFRVNAVNTAVTPCAVTVERAFYGTRASSHTGAASTVCGVSQTCAKVWVGPANYFGMQSTDANGNVVEPIANTVCVAANQRVLPQVNPSTGRVWNCVVSPLSTVSLWASLDPGVPAVLGATIASATTIAPVAGLTPISGTTAISNITVPAGLQLNGCIQLIPTGAYTFATGGTAGTAITAASTAIVGHVMNVCYNSTAALWVASY